MLSMDDFTFHPNFTITIRPMLYNEYAYQCMKPFQCIFYSSPQPQSKDMGNIFYNPLKGLKFGKV